MCGPSSKVDSFALEVEDSLSLWLQVLCIVNMVLEETSPILTFLKVIRLVVVLTASVVLLLLHLEIVLLFAFCEFDKLSFECLTNRDLTDPSLWWYSVACHANWYTGCYHGGYGGITIHCISESTLAISTLIESSGDFTTFNTDSTLSAF